jgi:hypothetical protein
MKVCRSDQCIYCEEFSVTHTIQKIGFMTSILLELEGNCAGHRTEIPFTVTRYRYIGNIYDVIVQHSLYIYETMLCNNNNFFFWQGEKRIKFGSIQTPKKLFNVNCLNGRGKKKEFQMPSWLSAYLAAVFLAIREFFPTPLYNRPLFRTSTAMQIRPSGRFSRILYKDTHKK